MPLYFYTNFKQTYLWITGHVVYGNIGVLRVEIYNFLSFWRFRVLQLFMWNALATESGIIHIEFIHHLSTIECFQAQLFITFLNYWRRYDFAWASGPSHTGLCSDEITYEQLSYISIRGWWCRKYTTLPLEYPIISWWICNSTEILIYGNVGAIQSTKNESSTKRGARTKWDCVSPCSTKHFVGLPFVARIYIVS